MKPTRSQFDKSHYGRDDYRQALQVHAMGEELLARGMTEEELRALLEKANGGFWKWDFLFPEKKP
jgi:hypothetical protein